MNSFFRENLASNCSSIITLIVGKALVPKFTPLHQYNGSNENHATRSQVYVYAEGHLDAFRNGPANR